MSFVFSRSILFHPKTSVLDLFSFFFRDLQQMFLVILSGPFSGLLAWSKGLTPHLKTVDPSPPPAPQLALLPNLAILHLPPPGQGDARKGATWCHPQRQTYRSEWMSHWFEVFKRCGFLFQMWARLHGSDMHLTIFNHYMSFSCL